MYNKKALTFTFHHYCRAFCQGAFVLDPPCTYEMIVPGVSHRSFVLFYTSA